MKKCTILISVFMIVVSLCACGQRGSETLSGASGASGASAPKTEAVGSSSETGANTASQEKQAGAVTIEITPPDGWKPVEGSVLPLQYMKGTAGFLVKAEPFSGATLDDVVNEALGIYQKSFGNFKIQGKAEPLTVDEKDARKLTFTCTVGKISMKYLYVYLFALGKTYVVTFGDQASTFDNLAADYETILNNIKFKAQ